MRNKLYEYGLYRDEVEDVLTDLIMDNFINEERFAKAFVGGKFRMKKWGVNKIKNAIQQHNISAYCLKQGLLEIDEGDYWSTMEGLILKKAETIDESNLFTKRDKVSRYLIYKGFESEKVWDLVKDLVK